MLINLKLVNLRAVRDQAAALVQVLDQRGTDRLLVEVHAADRAATLNQRKNLAVRLGMQRASLTGLRRLGQESLVGLNRLAFAANRAKRAVFHRFADAMRHEPRRLVGHAKGAADLMAADAFLGRAQQERRQPPFGERNLGALKYRADRDRELALAAIAVQQARTVGFLLASYAHNMVGAAAMHANRTCGPADSLKGLACCGFVGEDRGIEGGGHGRNPLTRPQFSTFTSLLSSI